MSTDILADSGCLDPDRDILVYWEDFDECGWTLSDPWLIVRLLRYYVGTY